MRAEAAERAGAAVSAGAAEGDGPAVRAVAAVRTDAPVRVMVAVRAGAAACDSEIWGARESGVCSESRAGPQRVTLPSCPCNRCSGLGLPAGCCVPRRARADSFDSDF